MAADTLPVPIEREIFFTKQVDQDSIAEVTKKIIEINNSDKYLKKFYKINGLKYKPKPIKILIDSYGGACYQIMGLVGLIENSKTPIYTIATGAAMSAGFSLLIAGHKRFAYKNATLMFHQVHHGGWGKIKDLEENLEETKRIQIWEEDFTLRKTRITKKQLKDNYEKKQDWYMTAEQSLKLKVIDEIIGE